MRPLFFICVMLLVLFSCRDKVICPAFQSTYILDDSVRQSYFSYLWKLDERERQAYLAKQKQIKDSIPEFKPQTPSQEYFAYVEPYVPPVEEVKRTKYGIVKYQPYWLKNIRMHTAPMENVIAPDFSKDQEPVDEGVFIASDFTYDSISGGDSVALAASVSLNNPGRRNIDSIAASQPKYRFKYDPADDFNMEQVYYNKYFGEQFKQPKVKPAVRDPKADSLRAGEKVGFFKRLFKKKKLVRDSTESDVMYEEDDLESEYSEEGFLEAIDEPIPEGGAIEEPEEGENIQEGTEEINEQESADTNKPSPPDNKEKEAGDEGKNNSEEEDEGFGFL